MKASPLQEQFQKEERNNVIDNKLLFDDIAVERIRRNVHFGNATIREYSVTVGALVASNEKCPLQLSWEYDSVETKIDIEIHESLKKNSRINLDRQSCRRLSLDERRLRIASVQDISLHDVQSLEFQAMMDQIKHDEENIIRLREFRVKRENNEFFFPIY